MATEIVIPMLGVTVENGKIVEWLVSEGDSVEKGQSLFVVEADKVTTEVESPASGVLAKILLPAGQDVPVLTVVGIITDPGEDIPQTELNSITKGAAENQAATSCEPQLAAASAAQTPADSSALSNTVQIVPAARHLAQQNQIDILSLSGSGPQGVITYKDVAAAVKVKQFESTTRVSTLACRKAESAGVSLTGIQGSGIRGRIMCKDVAAKISENKAEQPPAVVQPADAPRLGQIIPMDKMRQTIGRRLAGSAFTAPHVAFYTDVYMDPLLAYRKVILEPFEHRFGCRPSINDFLIKAVALTLQTFPMLNAFLNGDDIHIWPDINVGLAVAIPNGLVVPAVIHADTAGLSQIVRQRGDLVQRALDGQLTLSEMERGTFTISSLAQYDVTFFTSILNPPQSGILSVGKTRETLALVQGEVTVQHVSSMGLAVDHRIIDGVLAAKFLQCLKSKLENPEFAFMHS